MLVRRTLKLAVSAVTIASGLGLTSWGATATSAASAAPRGAVTAQPTGGGFTGSGSLDNTCTPSNALAVLTGPNGNWAAICGGPLVFNVAPYGPFTKLTIRVRNRVWLHQTYPAHGWADCFSVSNPPKTFNLSGRDQNPGDMQVSANTSPC